jgi:hypothetical protein
MSVVIAPSSVVPPGTLQIVELPQHPSNIICGITHHQGNTMSLLKSQPAWLMLAIASGGCAAFNGVFAKLYCSLPFHVRRAANKPQHNHGAHHIMGKLARFGVWPESREQAVRIRDSRGTTASGPTARMY